MFETKYNKFLTVLLVIIIIAVIILFGYLGYSFYKRNKTVNDADQYVSTFIEEVKDQETKDSEDADSVIGDINATDAQGKSSTRKTYQGFYVLGTIEIPKTGLNSPILEDPPTPKKLEKAIVSLYPQSAVLNTVGNVVLVGHNYRNGSFFSNNKKLTSGDKIYITDLDGKRLSYTIYNVFTAATDDTSFYNRDTDGKIEITLSTCTDDNSARTIVLARAD